MTTEHVLLNQKQVSVMLGISSSTVKRMVETGLIKQIRLGERTVRYRKNDVLKIIDETAGGDASA